MYTIVKRKNKYTAYGEDGRVIIISHSPRIVRDYAEYVINNLVNVEAT
jgi:hypothetical protein